MIQKALRHIRKLDEYVRSHDATNLKVRKYGAKVDGALNQFVGEFPKLKQEVAQWKEECISRFYVYDLFMWLWEEIQTREINEALIDEFLEAIADELDDGSIPLDIIEELEALNSIGVPVDRLIRMTVELKSKHVDNPHQLFMRTALFLIDPPSKPKWINPQVDALYGQLVLDPTNPELIEDLIYAWAEYMRRRGVVFAPFVNLMNRQFKQYMTPELRERFEFFYQVYTKRPEALRTVLAYVPKKKPAFEYVTTPKHITESHVYSKLESIMSKYDPDTREEWMEWALKSITELVNTYNKTVADFPIMRVEEIEFKLKWFSELTGKDVERAHTNALKHSTSPEYGRYVLDELSKTKTLAILDVHLATPFRQQQDLPQLVEHLGHLRQLSLADEIVMVKIRALPKSLDARDVELVRRETKSQEQREDFSVILLDKFLSIQPAPPIRLPVETKPPAEELKAMRLAGNDIIPTDLTFSSPNNVERYVDMFMKDPEGTLEKQTQVFVLMNEMNKTGNHKMELEAILTDFRQMISQGEAKLNKLRATSGSSQTTTDASKLRRWRRQHHC